MTKTIKNNKHFINDIPSNWFSSKLKYLMTILPKSDIPAGLGKEEGIYPFYTSSQLLTKRIDTCLYEGNSITMGTGGLASINYVDVPFATSTDCFNFTCGEMTKFIYYYLYSLLDVISNLGFEGMGLNTFKKIL